MGRQRVGYSGERTPMTLHATKANLAAPDALEMKPELQTIQTRRLTRTQQAYLWSFILAVFLCWSPFNVLGYLAPLLVTAVYLILAPSNRATIGIITFILIWFLLTMLHSFQPGFYVWSAPVWLLTNSMWALILFTPTRPLASWLLWDRLLAIVARVVFIEAIWGLTQAVFGTLETGKLAGSTGDYVEGTIHPSLHPELAFSNPIFATNMALLLIIMIPAVVYERKWRVPFVLGLCALVLASVVHVLFLLAVAVGIAILLYYPKWLASYRGLLLLAALTIAVLMIAVIIDTGAQRFRRLTELTLNSSTPRALVLHRVAKDLPKDYPLAPLVGLGPGQFSSRAGLITTGLFFGGADNPRTLPLLPAGMSDAFDKYVLDLWLDGPSIANSSSTRAWFGWLSVYVEWGALGILACITLALYLLLSVRKRNPGTFYRIHATVFGTGVLFILLLGVQENYWEVAQAILLGSMLLKVLYANLTGTRRMLKKSIR